MRATMNCERVYLLDLKSGDRHPKKKMRYSFYYSFCYLHARYAHNHPRCRRQQSRQHRASFSVSSGCEVMYTEHQSIAHTCLLGSSLLLHVPSPNALTCIYIWRDTQIFPIPFRPRTMPIPIACPKEPSASTSTAVKPAGSPVFMSFVTSSSLRPVNTQRAKTNHRYTRVRERERERERNMGGHNIHRIT